MNEEPQSTYHTIEFLEKRKNDPKWRPQYLERLEEIQNLKNKKEKKIIAFLFLIIIVELIILSYLMFFNPNASQEGSINAQNEVCLHSVANREEQAG